MPAETNRANARPNTIHLGGPMQRVDDYVAGESGIVPGDHIELFNSSGKKKWRRVSSATEVTQIAIALDQPLMNGNIDHTYSAGDQVIAAIYGPGGFFYGSLPSGENISNGELLAPNGGGTGMFKSAATTTATGNIGRLRAMQEIGIIAARTRVKIEVLY